MVRPASFGRPRRPASTVIGTSGFVGEPPDHAVGAQGPDPQDDAPFLLQPALQVLRLLIGRVTDGGEYQLCSGYETGSFDCAGTFNSHEVERFPGTQNAEIDPLVPGDGVVLEGFRPGC